MSRNQGLVAARDQRPGRLRVRSMGPGARGRTGAIVAAALAVALAAAAPQAVRADAAGGSQPGQPATFLIPPTDGYGVAECIAGAGECGRVVADGWCEANGYARASAFGPVAGDEVSGPATAAPGKATLSITCVN